MKKVVKMSISSLRCPECGQPVDILTVRTYPVTDPKTGHTTMMHDGPMRFCPSAFHFDPRPFTREYFEKERRSRNA